MSYYEILNLDSNASDTEIKQSYRNLAKQHHPDKGGDKEKFQKIQEAYDILSDPEKKTQYDNPIPSFNEFPFFTHGNGNGNGNAFDFPFNIFQNMRQNSAKKSDLKKMINISLEEVYNGTEIKFNLKKNIICSSCMTTCDKCNGSGNIKTQIRIGPMIQMTTQNCDKCKSSGKINNQNCNVCLSKGKIEESKTINVKIPKGVENNTTISYNGWGEQPIRNGEIAGDLKLIINIQTHPHFLREGLNLRYNVTISFKESIIGKRIHVPYFSEPFIFDMKEHCGIIDPEKDYIILQKGLRNDEGTMGNMYIKFKIIYPNYKILKNEEINKIDTLFKTICIE